MKQKMHAGDYNLKIARRTNNEKGWSAYKRLRNTVTTNIRHSKANYYCNIFQNNIDSPKSFWKSVKKSFPINNLATKSNIFNISGETTTDKNKIATGFCLFFTSLGINLRSKIASLTNKTWQFFSASSITTKVNPNMKSFKFKQVTTASVTRLVKLLKHPKHPDQTTYLATVIKDTAEEIAIPLSNLANMSLSRLGLFPTSEKCAKIIPKYKSDDHSSIDSYRPI